ncbi:fimbrial protein [Proteiniphilum sp.]|uniref:fimbrial protein n=1 Tax=Proteiniphilum sp. TaxID=1926877 RepID=UPI0033176D1E
MSNRSIYSIILLLAVMLPFTACDSFIYDDQPGEEPTGEAAKVYLSVSIQAARTSGLRTINEHANFEDRVHDLALLVFDTGSGEKVGQFFGEGIAKERTHYTFTVELTPGQRDFYFVANMPMAGLKDIDTRTGMETYLKTFTEGTFNRDLDAALYLGATDTEGFPMSRVYANQEVTRGGTAIQPKPFLPVPVVGEPAEDVVRMIRVVAKLEVDFGTNINKIANVYYKNAFRQFSLTAPDYTPVAYYTVSPPNTKGNPLKPVGNTFVYYMPEALMDNPAWSATGHQPVNYFVIETVDGALFNIPIITNTPAEIPDGNYMKFATGNATTQPNYNIYRNHHYHYTVDNLENIEIFYQVNPWDKVTKKLFMGYGYNVEVDEDGNITITNTLDDCMPHKVRLETMNGALFVGDPAPSVVEFGYDETQTPDPLKLKTGYAEQFKVNKESVASGAEYLKVSYNNVEVYTFKK